MSRCLYVDIVMCWSGSSRLAGCSVVRLLGCSRSRKPRIIDGRVPSLWSFVAITVPLVITPGASTAVVLRNSLNGGVRAGLVTTVGVNAGSLFYGLLSAFGFALALQRWPGLWLALRVVGVAVLGVAGCAVAVEIVCASRRGCRPHAANPATRRERHVGTAGPAARVPH